MEQIITAVGLVAGCFAIFQLGRAYELSREIRHRNDEYATKLR